MTDRRKLEWLISVFSADSIEKRTSTTIPENQTKIIWTDDGQIRSIIRDGKRFGEDK